MKLLPSVLCATALAAGWSYPEDGGHWGDSCHAQKAGSPIDLDYTYRNFHFKHLGLEDGFQFSDGFFEDRNWHFTNNGHSIVFTVADADHTDDSIQVWGGDLERPYNFHSFHFHWGNKKMDGGSEHTVNGRHHFAELHMVHYGTHCETFENCLSNDAEGKPNFSDGLAVLGAFIELDKNMDERDVNPRLKTLLNKAAWLSNANIDDRDLNNNGAFSLHDIGAWIDTSAFYRYQGSLTTPTCNEVVRWTVFKDTLKVNHRYARRFLRAVGDHDGGHLADNFRGVQPLADREVSFYSYDTTAARMTFASDRRFDNEHKQRHAPERHGGH